MPHLGNPTDLLALSPELCLVLLFGINYKGQIWQGSRYLRWILIEEGLGMGPC